MPTNRKRKGRKLKTDRPPAIIEHLKTGRWNADTEGAVDCLLYSDNDFQNAWGELKDNIMFEWIAEKAGTRPFAWWEVDCPRWKDDPFKGCFWHGTFPIPRERILGNSDIQAPWNFGLNEKPRFAYGIPRSFCYYNDKIKHYSPANDDILKNIFYESEASYLKRHGLLMPGEEKFLTEENYKPESAYNILQGGK